MQTSPLNLLQLLHKFGLQRFIIGFRPGTMLLQRLGDGYLEIETSPAHLTGDLCLGEGF